MPSALLSFKQLYLLDISDISMGYLTGFIQPSKFKPWLYFAGGSMLVNGSIVGINGTQLINKLREIWPQAEIVSGIAATGLIFAFLAAVFVILFRVQVFIEILYTADFAAILYAFYSFKPSIISLDAGIFIFYIISLLFILAYIVSQFQFINLIYKKGTTSDKIILAIIVICSIILFVAPVL